MLAPHQYIGLALALTGLGGWGFLVWKDRHLSKEDEERLDGHSPEVLNPFAEFSLGGVYPKGVVWDQLADCRGIIERDAWNSPSGYRIVSTRELAVRLWAKRRVDREIREGSFLPQK